MNQISNFETVGTANFSATGSLTIPMTNDYLFRALLQKITMYWSACSPHFFISHPRTFSQPRSQILLNSEAQLMPKPLFWILKFP